MKEYKSALVKEYMCGWVNKIDKNATLGEALKQMVDEKTNSLVIVDSKNRPKGVISSRLIIKEVVPEYLRDDEITSQFGAHGSLAKYAIQQKDKIVKDFMYKDFHCLDPDDAMIEAATYATKGARRILPVVNKEGELIGAITRTAIKIAIYNTIYGEDRIDPQAVVCPHEVKEKLKEEK
ncbi:MAG: CBS domain-containing protein [Patescibacteria group bacterium]